jgi:cell division protein FtsN
MMNIFIGLVLIGIVVIAVYAMINKKETPAEIIKEVAKEIEPVKPEPTPEPVKEVVAKVKKPSTPRKKKAE